MSEVRKMMSQSDKRTNLFHRNVGEGWVFANQEGQQEELSSLMK